MKDENREIPVCPVYKKCGGCTFQGISYEEQLKKKEKTVKKLLKGICPVDKAERNRNPYHYRNKVNGTFARLRDGSVISGIYEEGTHRVVPVESCLIEDEKADAIIRDVRGLLKSFKIKVYNEDSGYGLLRHVMVRTGFTSGQIMVVLVCASVVFPSKNNFVKALRKLHPEITTVVFNVNDRKTSMVLGERNLVLYGKGYIEDQLCGYTFRISPSSFYQVNPQQTKVLYSKALEYADLKGQELVWDLYCGIGTISLFLAQKAKQVYGVEIIKEAIDDARRNATLNHMDNVEFFVGKAEEIVPAQYEKTGIHPDVIVVDPPRKGCDAALLNTMLDMAPERIVYVSCDPATLARDLKILCEEKYTLEKVAVVDQFSHSVHVESVAYLQRVK